MRKYGCDFCSETFQKPHKKGNHMKKEHPEEMDKKHSSVKVSCNYCGYEFFKDKQKVSDKNFCDRDCQVQWLRNDRSGHGSYPTDWNNIREKVIRRDGGCLDCGKDFDLHVHHVNGDKSDNRMNNLETLCSSCHSERHMN